MPIQRHRPAAATNGQDTGFRAAVHALIAGADALLHREKQEQRLDRARAEERRAEGELNAPQARSERPA